ncbi:MULTISPECIES: SH3 domain-containing protein [unclassified Bacillus (in: firmicutes)]|uniref:SH3 domain-containing protein n=1 Tax=unclassified Bacillus (in: firmicutes) TaxID=185979 RepID=UPI0008E5BF75|nr:MULTISPECIES: SH3 domain-containing protein [unclassified Bacillus (in: firmicutes)]SFA94693.1 N-acetylmuramoyl-L-alanine amidase [Bacillus sp. UNCCL13]SFQ78591.1 N-acetylmuramoyl-L-alanine amidase [Bacillus sp. cl95]
MVKKISIIILCNILFWGFFQISPIIPEASDTVIINQDQVNIRQGPGLSYPIVKKANKNDSFSVIKEEADWIQLNLSGDKKGWVANWLVTKNKGSSESQAGSDAEVNTNDLRVRKGPGTNFQVIGYLNKGDKVKVLETNENWIEISSGFGEGWVSKQFLDISSSGKKNNDNTSKDKIIGEGTIQASSLNVRSKPSLSGTVLGKLPKGTNVQVYSQSTEWTEIQYSSQRAWISSQFIELQSDSKKSNSSQSTPSGIFGTVTATSMNVRNTAALDGKIIGTVLKGQKFTILEEKNNWAKVEYKQGNYGWIAGWYLEKSTSQDKSPTSQSIKESTVTIIHNGTNIRSAASVNAGVIQRANTGDTFAIKSLQNDWYEIVLKNGKSGFVAGWIVTVNGSAPQVEKPGGEMHLKDKTIIIDPGHGGGDNGTTGARGTLEKNLTIRTAGLLYDKLKSSGANVYLTRSNDTYLSLQGRVSTSHYHSADAFISIHYDSITDRSVNGMTTYFYHDYQKSLAETLNSSIVSQTKLKNRGTRFGDYHVLRENKQAASLLELGYLSNPTEEMTVNSNQYQETAASGIFNGLALYFKGK